jgi:hypothetical protein
MIGGRNIANHNRKYIEITISMLQKLTTVECSLSAVLGLVRLPPSTSQTP